MKIKKIQEILGLITREEMITVTSLQNKLNIPRTSLLRYLVDLEKSGEIIKTFGEVRIRKSQMESAAKNRTKSHIKEKTSIADFVKDIVKDKECIFIDGGTTTGKIAIALKNKEITIYTNNLLMANFLSSDYKPNVILVPGVINKDTLCAASIETHEYLMSVNFDKVFLGFNSLVENELATTNAEEALVKKLLIKNPNNKDVYAVGGTHKINKERSKFNFGNLKDVTLITEEGVNK